MKKTIRLLFIAAGTLLLFVSPAEGQISAAVEDLAADGLYAEQTITSDVELAQQTLASNNVAFAWLSSGDAAQLESLSQQLLDGLNSSNSRYTSLLVLSPEALVMESDTLTNSQIDTALDTAQASFTDGNVAAGLLQINNNLPNALASSSSGGAGSSGLNPDALPGPDSSVVTSSQGESSATTTSSSSTESEDSTTESGGGISLTTIIIVGVVLFLGYRFLKSRFGRNGRSSSGSAGSGPFGGSTGRSGGLGGAMTGGLGSILGSVLKSKMGSASRTQTRGTGVSSQSPISNGGNIFTGRSRRTRARSSRSLRRSRSRSSRNL